MIHLWMDTSRTWSVFAWMCITNVFPIEVIPGLTFCKESLLQSIPPFYAGILKSFAYVNSLNVSGNLGQQRNIWGTATYNSLHKPMIQCGFIEIADLPIVNGLLDHRNVQCTLQHNGYRDNVFLLCVALQNKFKHVLGCIPLDKQFPLHLENGAKKLLQVEHSALIKYTS